MFTLPLKCVVSSFQDLKSSFRSSGGEKTPKTFMPKSLAKDLQMIANKSLRCREHHLALISNGCKFKTDIPSKFTIKISLCDKKKKAHLKKTKFHYSMQVSLAIFNVKVHLQPERDWIDLCYTGEVPGKSYCCPKKNCLPCKSLLLL